jgi:hypothetical protein
MSVRYLLLFAVLLPGCASGGRPESFWVGHLAPLSGPGRDEGDQAVAAMNQALEQAREDEFAIDSRPLGVRHVDTGRGTGRAEAVRLLAVNRVCALVVGPGAQRPEEVVAAARLHGALVVVLDELADVPREGNGVVLLAAGPAHRGEVLADFGRHEQKRTRAAVVVDEARSACAAVAEGFSRAWRTSKGELRRWKVDDLRHRSAVDDLARFGPDLLLLAVGAEQPAGLDEAVAGVVGRAVVLYGGEDRDGHPLPWLERGAKDGPAVYTATAFSSLARLPEESRPLLDALRKKQGRAPGRTAVLALDAIRLLRQRAEVLRELDRAATLMKRFDLLDRLSPLESLDGVTGTMFWKEGQPVRPLFIVGHQGGQETVVRQVQAKP